MNSYLVEATEENAIRNLQRYLKQLSYFYPLLIKNIIITGVYDTNTRDAVTNMQRVFGVNANGIVDKLTWDMIFANYLQSINENSSTNGIFPFYDKPSDYEIKIGSNSQLVKIIEVILDEISSVYDFNNTVTSNGIYDESKVEAIKLFQSINLLNTTGNVDRSTWDSLANEYNIILRRNLAE